MDPPQHRVRRSQIETEGTGILITRKDGPVARAVFVLSATSTQPAHAMEL